MKLTKEDKSWSGRCPVDHLVKALEGMPPGSYVRPNGNHLTVEDEDGIPLYHIDTDQKADGNIVAYLALRRKP